MEHETLDGLCFRGEQLARQAEGDILENLKKGMVDNTEGEVLENLKKVNESLCRVVNMLQGPNSGETPDATKSISSTLLPRSSGPNTSSIFAEHQRLFGNVISLSPSPAALSLSLSSTDGILQASFSAKQQNL